MFLKVVSGSLVALGVFVAGFLQFPSEGGNASELELDALVARGCGQFPTTGGTCRFNPGACPSRNVFVPQPAGAWTNNWRACTNGQDCACSGPADVVCGGGGANTDLCYYDDLRCCFPPTSCATTLVSVNLALWKRWYQCSCSAVGGANMQGIQQNALVSACDPSCYGL